MTSIEVLLISLGLAMDCFAVAFAAAMAGKVRGVFGSIRMALFFGLFQGGMPVLGWLCGSAFRNSLAPYDHWIAFALLTAIALHLFYEAWQGEEPEIGTRALTWKGLFLLSVATSIDALGAGLSFAFLAAEIYWAALSIGIVAGLMTLIGLSLGRMGAGRLDRWAGLLGGLILLGIGIRIVLEHIQKGI